MTAQTLMTPRSLLTTRVASASVSTSSLMMRSGFFCAAIFSRIGAIERGVVIFFSKIST